MQINMKLCSLERLYHFRCGNCDGWWSVADKTPQEGRSVFCPHCGAANLVIVIDDPLDQELRDATD